MKKYLLSLLFYLLSFTAGAQDFGGSFVGDSYYNAAGGIRRGGGFMGMAGLTFGVEAWRGAEFYVHGAGIFGRSLTEHYLGDLQVASNIDAGEHIYLHELWYRQQLGSVQLTAGLQDLNAEFMVSEGAGEFVNSSFGVPPVIATGIPVPIFPLTGLGLAAAWRVSDRWRVQGAAFDGNQTAFEHNPHNVHWAFHRSDGVLAVGEVHLDDRYKLGAYYHSADKNYGFYAMADQPLTDAVSVFTQLAWAPKAKNFNNVSLAAGALLAISERHSLGAAFTHAALHDAAHHHETAVEAHYKYRLCENVEIKPDVQWVINPAGGDEPLADALVGILRINLEF